MSSERPAVDEPRQLLKRANQSLLQAHLEVGPLAHLDGQAF